MLSAIALSTLGTGNTSYHLAYNAITATQTEVAIEAAIARAVLGITDARPERRWRVDSYPYDFTSGRMKLRIRVQDELGRIDLNHADQSLLAGLFRSAGLSAPDANSLAAKILDWRDPVPGRRVNGAQDSDYRAAGFAYRPRGGAFQSVDELKLVMGVTPALYKRVQTALTVYTGRQFLDPQFAPREVLAALSGMNANTVASALAARAHQGSHAGIIDPAVSLRGRAFGIQIQSQGGDGTLIRDVVVRLTDDAARLYWVLSWRIK